MLTYERMQKVAILMQQFDELYHFNSAVSQCSDSKDGNNKSGGVRVSIDLETDPITKEIFLVPNYKK